MEDCLFCKIVRGEIPAKKMYEDDLCCVFCDIEPKAKYHYLMVAKEHFPTLEGMSDAQAATVGRMLQTIPKLKDVLHLDGGYRVLINQGDNAGQTVFHLHIHILAGQKMAWTPA